MSDIKTTLETNVPGTDIIVTLRASGALNIHTNVQHDRDNLEVRTPAEWDAIVSIVTALRKAQDAAMSAQ